MDSGRELLLDLRVGLDDGELSSEVGVAACSASDGGVVAAEEADGGLLARSRGAPGEGVSTESVRTCGFGGREALRKGSLLGDEEVGVGLLESL